MTWACRTATATAIGRFPPTGGGLTMGRSLLLRAGDSICSHLWHVRTVGLVCSLRARQGNQPLCARKDVQYNQLSYPMSSAPRREIPLAGQASHSGQPQFQFPLLTREVIPAGSPLKGPNNARRPGHDASGGCKAKARTVGYTMHHSEEVRGSSTRFVDLLQVQAVALRVRCQH